MKPMTHELLSETQASTINEMNDRCANISWFGEQATPHPITGLSDHIWATLDETYDLY